ncbi:MAG: riboflavin biosynthesis protein RibF [Clostridia bacterium]|nr:riboflavin biosynthesis protein RibF [Clostridia bacterium]
MKVIRIQPGCPPPDPGRTVAALGFFDGVHIGHRRLLDRAAEIAASRSLIPSVFTFSDDALSFKPDAARLTDFSEKVELFRLAGIERVYAADFPDLSGLSPERFVSEILVGQLNVSVAVCGFNFRFGAGAAGDSDALVRLMRDLGRDAEVIAPTVLDGTVVSSSAIRAALSEGDVALAEQMLGRPFSLSGRVEHGRGYGHTEGIPTVNLPVAPHLAVPRRGVYRSRAVIDGAGYPAVSNVGTRPTFGGTGVNCESYLLDYHGSDLYGRAVRVELLGFLRDERKFDTPEDLYRQIALDISAARV